MIGGMSDGSYCSLLTCLIVAAKKVRRDGHWSLKISHWERPTSKRSVLFLHEREIALNALDALQAREASDASRSQCPMTNV
jgi:hypothetical protein